MKISEIFAQKTITFSCEIFPPKIGSDIHQIDRVIDGIAPLHPDFISVTCGGPAAAQKDTRTRSRRLLSSSTTFRRWRISLA